MKNDKIYPLVFMMNLEPVEVRPDAPDSFITQDLKILAAGVRFNLTFSVFRDRRGGVELSYVMERILDPKIFPVAPGVIIEHFDSLESAGISNFVYSPIALFKPFKRAILVFEDKPHTVLQFTKAMEEWRRSLPKFE